jgi:hypothetical protein
MDCGRKRTLVDGEAKTRVPPRLPAGKIYYAYSHAPLRRRRLTMLNPKALAGGQAYPQKWCPVGALPDAYQHNRCANTRICTRTNFHANMKSETTQDIAL